MSYFNERKYGELLDGFQFTTVTSKARNLGNKDFLDFFSSFKNIYSPFKTTSVIMVLGFNNPIINLTQLLLYIYSEVEKCQITTKFNKCYNYTV